MKNELGIRICCENCKYYSPIKCIHFDACIDNLTYFRSSYLILQARIRELQEQQFTTEELQFIKRAIFEYSEMSDFDYKPILDKVERILNDENNM